MKRNLKRFSCVFIAVVMMLSSIPSFAFDIDGTEYVCAGELSEGSNTFFADTSWGDKDDEVDFYCTFTAENDGYYGFHLGQMHSYVSGEIYADDESKSKQECVYQCEFRDWNDFKIRLYYLTAGEYYFAGRSFDKRNTSVFFESLGESMTAVKFDDELLYGYNFFEETDSGFYTETETKIEFSSGKSFFIGKPHFECELESEFREGENKAVFEFLGESLPSDITIYKTEHYIFDVEISNVENYLNRRTEYYNGYENKYENIFPSCETVTVTFTDGTTYSFEIYEETLSSHIVFPNGQTYYCDIYYSHYGSDKGSLNVCVGDNIIKAYEPIASKASFVENIKELAEESKELVESSEEYFNLANKNFNWKDIPGTVSDSFMYTISSIANLSLIQVEVWKFILFYLGISLL